MDGSQCSVLSGPPGSLAESTFHLNREKLISDSLSHKNKDNETDSDCTQEGEKAAATLAVMGSLFGDLYKAAVKASLGCVPGMSVHSCSL